MLFNKNTTILQKSIIITLIVLGLAFISFAVVPELFGTGEKGFGYTQMFFIRNGLLIFITGLITLFFPGIINYIKQALNDNEYLSERTKYLTGQPLSSGHDFILLFLFLIAANFFAIYFLGKENTTYDWDASHFWTKYIEISGKFKDSPLGAFKFMLASIQHGEYNYFAPFLLIPFSLFFGVERLPYILSIVNIFGFLSAFSFLLLYKRFRGIMYSDYTPVSGRVIALFTFFAFPFLWMPILFGYVALGGFFVMNMVLFIYFKSPLSSQKYKDLMLIGILLSVMAIFHRWYSFWAVSFIITLFINELIFLYVDYGYDHKRFLVLLKKALFIVFCSGIFYLMIAGPRLLEVVTTDYTNLVVAYNPHNLLGHFKIFLNRFGLFYIILSVLGLFISFYYRRTRKFASFLLIQWIITFVLFTRISLFTYHHYYLLQPTILLFISMFMTELLMKARSRTLKVLTSSVYILVSIMIFTVVFIPGASSYANKAQGLLPSQRYYPLVREDIDEIKRILRVLDSHLTSPDDRVYVLAGSELLNSDTLMRAHLSLKGVPEIGQHFFRTNDLDLRDGFPSNLFKAKFIVVTDPIQCDLGCNKQRVISIPASAILNNEDMGNSYRRLPYEFSLERGVRAYIYERIESSVRDDMDFLSEALRKHYPDYPITYETHAE